ncbi:MAG TPA: helix-turn-helix transcriptional regulator [Gammaproteobacteria bacterium]|nr:helix-turn-helix transcriptional regulator [Gammaproteobacteria bacterium]
MGVGDRVRQVRQEKGITQKDLALLSGVCQQMISKLEVGKAQGSANIVRLALALDVSPAWLEGISPRKTIDHGKQVPANSTLNRKAVHACIEYLSGKADLLEAYNYRRQAELFTACYELCTQQKNRKLTKTSLITMLARRVKGL